MDRLLTRALGYSGPIMKPRVLRHAAPVEAWRRTSSVLVGLGGWRLPGPVSGLRLHHDALTQGSDLVLVGVVVRAAQDVECQL